MRLRGILSGVTEGLMKRVLAGIVFLAFAVAPAFAQRTPGPPPARKTPEKEDNKVIAQRLLRARYVMVMAQREADTGRSPDIEDLRTIADVESALRKWNRYMVVYDRQAAELIISVRRQGYVEKRTGGIGGGPTRGGTTPTIEMTNPNADYLAVYDAMVGTQSSPLWRKSMKDGLSRPDFPLLKNFKEEMDEAAKKNP